MKYTRLYALPDGASQFEEVEIAFTELDYLPPAPPLGLAEFSSATRCGFMQVSAGWQSEWHPSRAKNLFAVISGEWELTASDGSVRHFRAGDLLLVEDTEGRGHKSRVIADSVALMIELAAG